MNRLQRFWQLDNVSDAILLTEEEFMCENHFRSTFIRTEDRFVVKLPFKCDTTRLGNSKDMTRFYALETKVGKQPQLKQSYANFMRLYLQLGHMREVEDRNQCSPTFYLAHHAVLKSTSLTTK